MCYGKIWGSGVEPLAKEFGASRETIYRYLRTS
ncbi:helix-turn-helix domain-containing protein [Arsenophonus nasoniae]